MQRAWDVSAGRYVVKLDAEGGSLKLRPANVELNYVAKEDPAEKASRKRKEKMRNS